MIAWSVDDLPAPFAPIRPTISPGSDLERELAYSLDAAVANPEIGDDQAHDSSTGASPRYAAVTSRLERISAGAPSASTLP